MSDREALQAFQDAYNEAFGWPKSPIEIDSLIQQATLAGIKAAAPFLSVSKDYQDTMSSPEQYSYILEQLRLESEGDQ